MVRTRTLVLGAGGLVAAMGLWNLYQRNSVETVPYTVVASVGDVELRRYPEVVHVETVAATEREAFGRLFQYISGANEANAEIEMTAPVAVDGQRSESDQRREAPEAAPTVDGTSIPMTTPVETETAELADGERGVRMAFVLPTEYDFETAPAPTDDDVHLVAVPERTLAVAQFSWRPTEARIASETERLLDTLERGDVPVSGDPFFMGYDAPWTLPFLRRNEVAVEVRAGN
jgi:hypothetical protein